MPGLCVYNDACFTDEDWRGIRKLRDSVKVKDPLKVGRFGLGFKSVFHLTGDDDEGVDNDDDDSTFVARLKLHFLYARGACSRAVNFEACCQWALLNVHLLLLDLHVLLFLLLLVLLLVRFS